MRMTLAAVLVYDLVNNRKLDCSAKLVDPIMKNKTRIRAEYVKLKIKAFDSLKGSTATILPFRYARVNIINCSMEKCIEELILFGFEETSLSSELKKERQFCRDEHISNLLVFLWQYNEMQ